MTTLRGSDGYRQDKTRRDEIEIRRDENENENENKDEDVTTLRGNTGIGSRREVRYSEVELGL